MRYVIFLWPLLLVACGVNGTTDGTAERAKAEELASTEVQSRYQATKAEKMESELRTKQAYYQAIAGKYEGEINTNDGSYNIRVSLVPSLLPYSGTRVRELGEIENDLNNLFFYVQIVQWHPSSAASAVGCRVYNIRPNMDTGYLVIASPDCPNLYQIYLSEYFVDRQTEIEEPAHGELARRVSSQVRSGEISTVNRITGTLQPSTNASIFSFDARRVD